MFDTPNPERLVERAIKTYAKSGDWPDTVHIVTIDHTYGPNREYVIGLCGRKGTGKTAYESSPRCKKCQKVSVGLLDKEEG